MPLTNRNIYKSARDILAMLSLDSFFSLNPLPSLLKYPNIETFKNGFISVNERLYKEAKKEGDSRLKRTHLAILEGKPTSARLKNKLGRGAMKYVHSVVIIKLLNAFFSLFEYHHTVRRVYPGVFTAFFETIFTVFGSLERSKIQEMFKEASSSPRMLEFYQEMYKCWEEEMESIEKQELLQKRDD